MSVRVVTNHKARGLMMWVDLPESAQKHFDYLDPDEMLDYRFVKYLGEWYDVKDAQVINGGTIGDFPVAKDHPLYGWSSIQTDSAFTGVVFRWPRAHEAFARGINQYDYVIVGRYIA